MRRRSSGCAPTIRCGASASSPSLLAPGGVRRLGLDGRAHPRRISCASGVVTPVPMLRREAGRHAASASSAQRHAKRLPKGLKPNSPGEIVQIDTLFVNIAPDKADQALHRLRSGRQMDRRPRRQPRNRRARRSLPRQAHRRGRPSRSGHPGRRRVGVQGRVRARMPERQPALFVLPPKRPQLNGPVEARKARGDTSSTPSKTCPSPPQTSSSSASTPSPIASITQGLTKPLTKTPQPSTSQPSARRSPVSHGLNPDTRLTSRDIGAI